MTITALMNLKEELDRRVAEIERLRAAAEVCKDDTAMLAAENERLRAELDVSEAVNRAKTELLIDVNALLSDPDCTPHQSLNSVRTLIVTRTGPPKSDAVQRCAECVCDDPPNQCDWIKPR